MIIYFRLPLKDISGVDLGTFFGNMVLSSMGLVVPLSQDAIVANEGLGWDPGT